MNTAMKPTGRPGWADTFAVLVPSRCGTSWRRGVEAAAAAGGPLGRAKADLAAAAKCSNQPATSRKQRRMDFPSRPPPPLPVGVSACLTGAAVRYDGADAASSLPARELRGFVRLCGLCPEVGIGMGTPRPPIRLVGDSNSPRALRVDRPEVDVTNALSAFADAQNSFLEGGVWLHLHGAFA